jgi:hypothetical protein
MSEIEMAGIEKYDKNVILTIILFVLLLIVSTQIYYSVNTFENVYDNDPTLLIFVSTTCPHCVTYNEQTHPIVEKELADTNIKIKKVWANDDPTKLYEKYNVMYVPSFWLVKGDKKEQLKSMNPKVIKEIAKTM